MEIPVQVVAAAIGAILAGMFAFGINYYYVVVEDRKKEQRRLDNEREKEQRKFALELYIKLMTDEYFVKARLVSQTYLLPDGAKHKIITEHFDKRPNIIEITNFLSNGTDEDKEARFYIRAISNFFMAVELARRDGLIREDEKVFSGVYAYYWNYIISPYVDERCNDDEQFQKLEGLLDKNPKGKSKDDIYSRSLYISKYSEPIYQNRFEKPQKNLQLAAKEPGDKD